MSTELATATVPRPELSRALEQVEVEEKLFALAQRKARVYAESSLVPKEYQNNIGNVLIADNMARRMGADTLMVMQNLYIVHNRPGWSAQFLIATFNSNGRFTAIKYEFFGTPGQDDWGCTAYTKEIATEDVIRGTRITWAMAKKEGWVEKNGSKWKTMPEQMFRYRAATFLIRSTAPEIGMGLMTKEELEDITIDEPTRPAPPSLDSLADRLLADKSHATNGNGGETNGHQTDTNAPTGETTATNQDSEPAESDVDMAPLAGVRALLSACSTKTKVMDLCEKIRVERKLNEDQRGILDAWEIDQKTAIDEAKGGKQQEMLQGEGVGQ